MHKIINNNVLFYHTKCIDYSLTGTDMYILHIILPYYFTSTNIYIPLSNFIIHFNEVDICMYIGTYITVSIS